MAGLVPEIFTEANGAHGGRSPRLASGATYVPSKAGILWFSET
jgi:hypothetical protein